MLVGAKRKLLTVMIDEGTLERLTVGVQRAVERDGPSGVSTVIAIRSPRRVSIRIRSAFLPCTVAVPVNSSPRGNTLSPSRLRLLYVTHV